MSSEKHIQVLDINKMEEEKTSRVDYGHYLATIAKVDSLTAALQQSRQAEATLRQKNDQLSALLSQQELDINKLLKTQNRFKQLEAQVAALTAERDALTKENMRCRTVLHSSSVFHSHSTTCQHCNTLREARLDAINNRSTGGGSHDQVNIESTRALSAQSYESEEAMFEYFQLTVLASKLNSNRLEDVWHVDGTELFQQAKRLGIPFHRWANWIESRLKKESTTRHSFFYKFRRSRWAHESLDFVRRLGFSGSGMSYEATPRLSNRSELGVNQHSNHQESTESGGSSGRNRVKDSAGLASPRSVSSPSFYSRSHVGSSPSPSHLVG
eukprot:GILK01014678.1.p1 GENE.GILK01014678.1~~GILK01014678.1.p1  ORF type:complete len:327 (+),score=69.49 GILK01014678.1:39-1019(+)